MRRLIIPFKILLYLDGHTGDVLKSRVDIGK